MLARPRTSRRTWLLALGLALVSTVVGIRPAEAGHVRFERVGGDNRYETAAQAAELLAGEEADTVFVVRGDHLANGLAAPFAVGSLGVPFLFTRAHDVPAVTLETVDRLDVRRVVLIGGREVISDAVGDRFRDEGYKVDRVGGRDRYETAAAVARRYGNVSGVGEVWGMRTALVASGEGFRDAVVAGPLAAGAHFPLLLTRRHEYGPEVSDTLERLDIEQVYIVGDTDAVGHAVHARLEDEGYQVERLGGDRQQETAAAVAQFSVYHLRWSLNDAHFVDQHDYPNALVAAPLAGMREGAVFVADDRPGRFTERWLAALCPRVGLVRAVGESEVLPIQWHYAAFKAADSCHA